MAGWVIRRTPPYPARAHGLIGMQLLLMLLLVCTPTARATTLTRGPYLQLATPESITVRWRTDAPTASSVDYGLAPDALSSQSTLAPLTTEHIVTLGGLTPDTIYYYAVGSGTGHLAGADADHYFLTPPLAGTDQPTRVWVLGDSGTADASAQAVREAYLARTGSIYTDLWLMLGDNAYTSGTDAQYQDAVFDMYPTLLRTSVLWPTLGNHDGVSADSATQTGPYYDIFTLPKNGEAGGVASLTEAYYSFDHANIHFICLESFETDRSPGSPMLQWLAADLAATSAEWVIAFWHHPPYSMGSHNSDTEGRMVEMRENVVPLLEAAGVDLVLSGHSHAYERSWLLDGHYGLSTTFDDSMKVDGGDGRFGGDGRYQKSPGALVPHEGTVYMVAGSSGRTGGGSFDHPAMYWSGNPLGSVILDFADDELYVQFLDNYGITRDFFSILKREPHTAAPGVIAVGLRSGLREIRPNPFNPRTVVSFEMVESGIASIRIFDLAGRRVADLASAWYPAGVQRVDWRGTDFRGRAVASGAYLVEFRSGTDRDLRKVTLVR